MTVRLFPLEGADETGLYLYFFSIRGWLTTNFLLPPPSPGSEPKALSRTLSSTRSYSFLSFEFFFICGDDPSWWRAQASNLWRLNGRVVQFYLSRGKDESCFHPFLFSFKKVSPGTPSATYCSLHLPLPPLEWNDDQP